MARDDSKPRWVVTTILRSSWGGEEAQWEKDFRRGRSRKVRSLETSYLGMSWIWLAEASTNNNNNQQLYDWLTRPKKEKDSCDSVQLYFVYSIFLTEHVYLTVKTSSSFALYFAKLFVVLVVGVSKNRGLKDQKVLLQCITEKCVWGKSSTSAEQECSSTEKLWRFQASSMPRTAAMKIRRVPSILEAKAMSIRTVDRTRCQRNIRKAPLRIYVSCLKNRSQPRLHNYKYSDIYCHDGGMHHEDC